MQNRASAARHKFCWAIWGDMLISFSGGFRNKLSFCFALLPRFGCAESACNVQFPQPAPVRV
jgi:hypothetical protein